MKKLSFILISILVTTLFHKCDKGSERMDDFFAEFATVLKQGDSYRFELDNGKILIPGEIDDFSGNEGDRVVIYWTPQNGDSIKITRILPVYKGGITTEGYPNMYINDPLKVESVWVEGDYLNLILEIDYHSKSHSIALFSDPLSKGVDLYLAHSENDDPLGYPQTVYVSFLISTLRGQSNETVPFRLFINTHDGVRQFNFMLIGTG